MGWFGDWVFALGLSPGRRPRSGLEFSRGWTVTISFSKFGMAPPRRFGHGLELHREMVLEEALVRMVLTMLMLPLRGVSRNSSNLSREQRSHFQKFGMAPPRRFGHGLELHREMVLEEALVRMVLTVLMLPLRGVSRSSSNLSREQLQHHIMCNNKNAFASSVFPQFDFCFVLRASSLFPKYVFRASSSERASAHKAC